MHKQIIHKAIKELDEERANYFESVVAFLGEHPKTEDFPNLVYLSLKDILDIAPIYIDKKEFSILLLQFVIHHQGQLQRIIYDKEYLFDPSSLRKVTNLLIESIVEQTIHNYEKGDIDDGEPVVQKFTYPYRATDLVDEDDEEALEEARKRQAAYTGPERRNR
jgi:hypothetical protein